MESGFGALTVALAPTLPGVISLGGQGDKPDGSLWAACPAIVSHTVFPLKVRRHCGEGRWSVGVKRRCWWPAANTFSTTGGNGWLLVWLFVLEQRGGTS